MDGPSSRLRKRRRGNSDDNSDHSGEERDTPVMKRKESKSPSNNHSSRIDNGNHNDSAVDRHLSSSPSTLSSSSSSSSSSLSSLPSSSSPPPSFPTTPLTVSNRDSKKDNALAAFSSIANQLKGKRLAVFLDYDGTLTPIVANPSDAIITEEMRRVVDGVSKKFYTAIITGRPIDTITKFVALDHLYYAGSHGFDIRAPGNTTIKQVGADFVPDLQSFYNLISEKVKDISGALVEDSVYSVSVHYRNVDDESQVQSMEQTIDRLLVDLPKLCKRHGKKVWEIRPQFEWDKGRAVRWLLDSVFDDQSVVPLYIGDDITDEDAFRVLLEWSANGGQSVGICVKSPEVVRQTAATHVLTCPAEVEQFLTRLSAL